MKSVYSKFNQQFDPVPPKLIENLEEESLRLSEESPNKAVEVSKLESEIVALKTQG